MNLAAVTEINKQANADVQISAAKTDAGKLSAEAKNAIGNRPAYDLKITCQSGGKQVQSFGTGMVSVEIPYKLQNGETAGGVYAVHVEANGKAVYLTNSGYDAERETLVFSTNHLSVYGVGYKNPAAFTDIQNHWAKTDIEFAVNRGLLNGTGNTTFAPDSLVTREQMAVIMEQYAKVIGFKLPEVHAANTFADNAKIGSWASPSVRRVQMAGIITGKTNNVFDPQGTATRAEVSAVLKRFVEVVIFSDTAQGWMRNDSGKWMYYVNGKAVTGTKTIGGTTYSFNSCGEMAE